MGFNPDKFQDQVLQEIAELEEKITVLKAERDEAVRTRNVVHQQLMTLLAVIHHDGGHFVSEHGVEKAIEVAHERIIAAFKSGAL